MRATCSECRYFDPFDNDDARSSGRCKRWPPVLYVQGIDPNRQANVDPTDWHFPVLPYDETCGEHVSMRPFPSVRERS